MTMTPPKPLGLSKNQAAARSARSQGAAERYIRLLVGLVFAYPVIWSLGLGGFFIIITAIPSIAYLLRARMSLESRVALLIGVTIAACVPIGIIAFQFDVNRVVSVFGNIAVWVTLAAGLDAARRTPLTHRMVYALVSVGLVQGVLTFIASIAFPTKLPLPFTKSLADLLPTGPASFARSDLFFSGWLNGVSYRSEGIMSNATWAGAFAAVTILVAVAEFRRSRHKLFLAAGIAFSAVSVYYSLSRTTYLLTILGLAAGMLFLLRRRSRAGFVGAVAVAVPLVVAFLLTSGDDILKAADEVNEGRSGSAISRGAIYTATFDYILRLGIPLFGYGIKPKEQGLVASVATHSTYLGITFRAGIIGLGLLLFLVILLARQALRNDNIQGAMALTFISFWMAVGDIDPGHLLPFFLLICVAPRIAQSAPEAPTITPPSQGPSNAISQLRERSTLPRQ